MAYQIGFLSIELLPTYLHTYSLQSCRSYCTLVTSAANMITQLHHTWEMDMHLFYWTQNQRMNHSILNSIVRVELESHSLTQHY